MVPRAMLNPSTSDSSSEGTSNRSNKPIEAPPGCRRVFVKNLPYDCTEEEVSECFKECGKITSVRLAVWGHTQQLKGFGYVDFKKEESAVIAVKKNGKLSLKKRPLIID